MAYSGSITSGNEDQPSGFADATPTVGRRVLGARVLFQRKNPGSPGKLGKTSTKAESLSKLRGKGALA